MLIGRVELTDKGVRIVDVDGSHVDLTAEDAVELALWTTRHSAELSALLAEQNAKERIERDVRCVQRIDEQYRRKRG